MQKHVWVLTSYMEEEPGHPVVFRPIVDFDKDMIDQKYNEYVAAKEQRTVLAWGCSMTRHLVTVPTTQGRE